MNTVDVKLETKSATATAALGERLALLLDAGDLLLLKGDLGGGKTTFTRGLLAGLAHPDPRVVASPTYALHHRYEGGRLAVDHLDLYRAEDPALMDVQGLLDPLLDPDGIVVVEWSERLAGHAPRATVELSFEFVAEERRRLTFRFGGPRARELADALT